MGNDRGEGTMTGDRRSLISLFQPGCSISTLALIFVFFVTLRSMPVLPVYCNLQLVINSVSPFYPLSPLLFLSV